MEVGSRHCFFLFRLSDSEIKETVRLKAPEIVSGDKGDFKFKPGRLFEVKGSSNYIVYFINSNEE